MFTKFGDKFVVALENFQLYTPSVPTSSSTTGSQLDPYQGCQRKSRLPRPAKSRPCPASTLLYSTLLYCGPRPKVFVIDGIAMGLMKSRLDKNEEEFKNDLGKKSKIEFVGSKYKDRMFIKLSKNRKKIRTAAIEKDWPVLGNDGDSDSDPEYEVGEKRKKNEQDEGMEIFTNFVKELDQSVKPSSAILMLMENLSSSSSTIGMMQEFDEDLIHKIQLFLKGEEKYNFLSGIENVQLNIEVRRKYPTLMKILEASADPDGTLKKPVRYECSFFFLFLYLSYIYTITFLFL